MRDWRVILSPALVLMAGLLFAAPPPATVEAIHKLVHAGRFEEMTAKADSLPPGDPDWKQLLDVLFEAGELRNDFSYVKRKAAEILLQGRDQETRGAAAFALGVANWKSGQLEEAASAFSKVSRILPGSEMAAQAEGNIYEIGNLRVGQPAPRFVVQTASGAKLDLDELRGKVVLLNFWASW